MNTWRLAHCGPYGVILDTDGRPADAATRTGLMFPGRGEHAKVALAQAVCVGCPVAEPCLEEGLARGRTPGIWGGTTEQERILIRQQRRTLMEVRT